MVTMEANANSDRADSPSELLAADRKGPSAPGLERLHSCPAGTKREAGGVRRLHPPLQNVQSDSSGYVPKRKACVVKLDGCRFTIGR